MDRLRLLVVPPESLTLGERALALVQARAYGRAAAERARSADQLEEAPLTCFLENVVRPAAEAGLLSPGGSAQWEDASDSGQMLRDSRVQAFFFGWHERATEILAEIAESPDDSPLRARWFLDSIEALPHPPRSAEPGTEQS